jgi:hypothetical protein
MAANMDARQRRSLLDRSLSRLGLAFWPLAILVIAMLAALFFVGFDYYVVPVKQGQLALAVGFRDGLPQASAKPQNYPVIANLKGTVDVASLSEGKLHLDGWAIDDDDPDDKPLVLVFLDGRLIGSTAARVFRPDLLVGFNLNNGSVGFEANIETDIVRIKGHALRVVATRLKPDVAVNELGYGPDVHFETSSEKP